jgi:hypothetical protein
MDAIDFDFDEDDDLSTALGNEALAARDMVPEDFDNIPRAPRAPEQLIQGRRYLVVEQSANRRSHSKVSKIWQHGSELRALDTPKLDKHWLCNLCERVFSSAKKLIIPERNSLADDTIEAVECLKAWFDKGFVMREENGF